VLIGHALAEQRRVKWRGAGRTVADIYAANTSFCSVDHVALSSVYTLQPVAPPIVQPAVQPVVQPAERNVLNIRILNK